MNSEEDEPEDELSEREKKAVEQRDYDVEALKYAHIDLRDSANRVLDTFSHTADKAIEMVKLNGIMISILVAASTQVEEPSQYINIATWISASLFLISILLGLIDYLSRSVITGLRTQERLIERKLTEEEYLRWVVQEEYDRWLQSLLSTHQRKARYVQASIGFL